MRERVSYRRLACSWWGFPLFLPLLLLPLSSLLSARLTLEEGSVYLIYLPLAMMVALLMVFDWAAIPGIALALAWRYMPLYGEFSALFTVGAFLVALCGCWWGYRLQTGGRWGVNFGELRLSLVRLFWLTAMLPAMVVILIQLMVTLELIPAERVIFTADPFTLRNLIFYQSGLIAALTATQVYYCLIRIVRSPHFARILWKRLRDQIAPEVGVLEIVLWLASVVCVIAFLIFQEQPHINLLATDYSLTLILPAMLWSAMRFGYLFTSLSWAFILQLLYQFRQHEVTAPAEIEHIVTVSANMLVFTITLLLMAAVCTRQRRTHLFARKAAFTDPVIGLPNLRSLMRELGQYPVSRICFLRIPELDNLGRTYGLQLRILYKQGLAKWLQPDLAPGEGIYQLPGFDLAIRLHYNGQDNRVEAIEARLRQYRLMWNGLPLHPRIGISYCTVKQPISHLYELLGELSEIAELSLQSGRAESLQLRSAMPVQRSVENKLALLNEIQGALAGEGFVLMAQKIQGVRGDHYHEVLLRLNNTQGEWIKPEQFLPLVHEFGLTWELDLRVLDDTLAFFSRHREQLPGARFAVNVFASTLCRPHFANELSELLTRYQIEPWQLIIEVEESQVLSDFSWGNRTLAQVRHLGCRVAIDDYGTGYSSYMRLREVNVDILKIEGSFVKNMLNSSLDYQIVESICAIARLKKMRIVAKHVESTEVIMALKKLGVDYMQGYAIAPTHPLSECVGEAS
ncbi:hypothetical protein CIG19_14635 [Enterobacterales bacterium CwR94]|nr:hypothetical protein CIG19_14635 [Enterobacterales bacterium CwR94]